MTFRSALLSMATRASHLCVRASCKHCMARGAVHSLRAVSASAKLARHETSNKEYELGRLAKPIDQEIEFQTRLIREEDLSVQNVLESHRKLISENNIAVEDEDGSVRLTVAREGVTYVVKFECSAVADSLNSAKDLEEQDRDDAEAEAGAQEENDEDDDLDESYEEEAMPFNVSVEVRRDAVKDKHLELELEVSPALEGGKYDLYVMDLTLVGKAERAYGGPSFDTLDDSIREQFDQFASKNFRKMMPLVADYARAREARLYGDWLHELKTVVAN